MKKTGFLSIALSLFLMSCDSDPDADKIVVRLPGTLVQSLSNIPWSPQVPYLQGTLLEGLYGYDRNLDVVPKIAAETKISDGMKRWVFRLDPTKRWSNGNPVRAEDFVESWLGFCSPDEVTSPLWASFLMYVVNAEEYKAGIASAEEVGVRVIDSLTIEVLLRKEKDIRPFLVLPSAMPLHRPTVAVHGRDWWKPAHFVGNGPYLPVEFVADDRIVLEKNPAYVGETGNVDRFVIKAGGLLSQMQNYQSGALDVSHILGLGDYRYTQKSKGLHGEVREQQELGFHGYQIARTVNPLMHDPRIRRALAMSVDKKRIAETVMGGRVVPTQWFGPPNDSMLFGLDAIPYDPDEAIRLLSEAGYFKEKPEIFMFATPSNDYRGWGPVAEALHAMWKEVGFNVTIQPYEEGILNQYAWGTGFYPGPEFERPGMTMYTGKMLWKDPTMMLRLADHTWMFHNFPYPLKEKLKGLALDARQYSSMKNKGSDLDWQTLDAINLRLLSLRKKLLAEEQNPMLREDIAVPDYHSNYLRVRQAGKSAGSAELKNKAWVRARTLLYDAEDKYLKYSENHENLPILRILAELERADESKAPELVRTVQQQALDEGWIVPLYSEKLVYLIRPWISGEVLNKFGGWLCFFNLQYMQVDSAAYFASKGR